MTITQLIFSCVLFLGKPVTVSCAYTGRIAVAYRIGEPFQRKVKGEPNSRFCNLYVAIYECESTGNLVLF